MEQQSLRLPPQDRDLFRGGNSMDATLCGWHHSWCECFLQAASETLAAATDEA